MFSHHFIFSILIFFGIFNHLFSQASPPIKEYKLGEYDSYLEETLIFDSPFRVTTETDKSIKFGKKGVFLVNGLFPGNKFQLEKQHRYGTFNIEENLEISEECKNTLSIILKMSEKCKEILLLRGEGSTMEEIKEIMGLNSLGTALSRLSNCRKELRGLI